MHTLSRFLFADPSHRLLNKKATQSSLFVWLFLLLCLFFFFGYNVSYKNRKLRYTHIVHT